MIMTLSAGAHALHYLGTDERHIGSQSTQEFAGQTHYAFGYMMDEVLRVTLEDQTHRRTAKVLTGELFFVPPNCRCLLKNNGHHHARVIWIRFQILGGAEPSQLHLAPRIPHKGSDDFLKQDELQLYSFRMPHIFHWIPEFLSDCGQPDTALYYQLQSHLYKIAAAFTTFLQSPKSVDDDLVEYVDQAKQYLLEHYNQTIDVEEMARLSGSSRKFYQAFRGITGLSPHKFVTTTRLNRSLGLLGSSPSSVAEVAHTVGYSDELYFSRLFKKHMGLSPSDYIKNAQVRVANLSAIFHGNLSVLGITPKVSLHKDWFLEPDLTPYMEQIRNCHPDVILCGPLPEELLASLSHIAPVTVIHWRDYSWKETLLIISRVFGLSSVAQRWLTYFDMKVENAREHIRERLGGKPFLLVSAQEKHYRVYGLTRKKMRDLFYDELKITPPKPAEEVSFLDTFSLHEVASWDCDNVLFFVSTMYPNEYCLNLEAAWRRLKQTHSSRQQQIIFIRHQGLLMYNATMHDSLIDETMYHLLSKS
ncbi:helix-turn-helix domain-containing protein [Paenibacillus aceris]|uniref:AraC-like DNA-binding protein/ABC-type Fe3+-hydroxamate transport system substrate-binding protein n=1 Tax=Paenibacillus aceris TaxID=869555 RepID=A0ABS4I5C4_9BACL|nr:helix-turn-helix domain-containing protein [Paenibacillus aceris]MBP1966121.1 AraC-like DNA-binding protein/ABC-type Fe3+-hydroxamate transport system substrate-binding protein [Paenibacillus aceris]NHW39654.1 helix-turn-helix domain-containing protein [Paenibacillus aceris]